MFSKKPTKMNKILQQDCQEWIDSLDYILRDFGDTGVQEIMSALQNHALQQGIDLGNVILNTPYINSISNKHQVAYPGDIELEKRIENIIRWNAMAIVMQAYDQGEGVGGHIATYASAATMLETGFNHCFKSKSPSYGGDMVLVQPHASPGIYARAYLEGRLTEKQLQNFRRELGDGGGLSSYPHPRSMPDFWEMPNASMGLSAVSAIYQARFSKYLENRGLKPNNGGKIWCFIGDGEADEPEVIGSIAIAAREKLDNLVFIINCNLQRLDGPVRGNGKIIQELERSFRGAGWNITKVIWGSGWDSLLAQDNKGILQQRMEECLDGDYQRYSVLSGEAQRKHWVNGNPELEAMMASLTDKEILQIKRGGQDPKKIFAAYDNCLKEKNKPTVILIKTVKGEGMGASGQGKNTTHQKKNLTPDERIQAARNYGIPLNNEEAKAAQFYRPPNDSDEIRYLQKQRQQLGGYLPKRDVNCPSLKAPDLQLFKEQLAGSNKRHISTTMSMVRILSSLLKDSSIGQYIVPIVPDEARTFGLDALFGITGIYSPESQNYIPVDADSLLPYHESPKGQILQEGICETGAIASFMAAGTAYAVHGIPTIPFYIYYSMFGFQRVGDMIYACNDMMTRGFLLGGTAGRTTLNGEGLQHQDGHSHILATTIPSLLSYDPAFAYEVAIIIRDGIYRMYEKQDNIFYYITLYNENLPMPALSDDHKKQVIQGVIQGGYCWKRSHIKMTHLPDKTVHLLASGSIMQQAIIAAEALEKQGITTHIWSITSFTELAREAESVERFNRLNPKSPPKTALITQLFTHETGIAIAVTDYMKTLPASIAKWMPLDYTCLGTDGVGVSESRPNLRDYFEISDRYIITTALYRLYKKGIINAESYHTQYQYYQINNNKPDPVKH